MQILDFTGGESGNKKSPNVVLEGNVPEGSWGYCRLDYQESFWKGVLIGDPNDETMQRDRHKAEDEALQRLSRTA